MSRLPRLCSVAAAVLAAALLGGCDMIGGALGIESPEKVAASREAEGKAVGGACRQAGRAIEDCYALNRKAEKAAVFAGWREMNDYMRENKLEAVTPALTPPPASQVAKAGADGEDGKPAPKAEPAGKARKGKDS